MEVLVESPGVGEIGVFRVVESIGDMSRTIVKEKKIAEKMS